MYYNTKTKKREELPISTATISNFNLLSQEELREHGYYPITRPPLEDWQEYTNEYTIVWDNAEQGVRDIDIEDYKARKVSEVNAKTHETIIARFTMEDQQNQSDEAIEILGKIIMQTATPESQARLLEINENKQWRDWVISEGKAKKEAIAEATTHEEVYNLMSE